GLGEAASRVPAALKAAPELTTSTAVRAIDAMGAGGFSEIAETAGDLARPEIRALNLAYAQALADGARADIAKARATLEVTLALRHPDLAAVHLLPAEPKLIVVTPHTAPVSRPRA